jgi:DNA polymerase elongation subunit (family B)
VPNLKVLFLDIETAPFLAYVWHPADQYVNSERLVQDNWIMTWAAKWAHSPQMYTGKVTGAEALEQNDTRIIVEVAKLIREADYIVAHHGDRFDLPMINGRILKLDLEPLGPVQTIDTLKLAKANFKLGYNKLDWLGQALGVGEKIKTSFDLWRNAYHGDTAAIKEMSLYNAQDVLLLEAVFHKMAPHVKGLKRLFDADYANQRACPFCGAEDELVQRGTHRTQAGCYQKYRCGNCGKYSRERVANVNKRLTVIPL